MEKSISIKQVLDNIMDDSLLDDLTFERAVNYVVRFIRILGIPQLLDRKTVKVEIKNYKGVLPCDYYQMIEVRDLCSGRVYDISTGSFVLDDRNDILYKYKIQNNIIIVSHCKDIEISYDAIAVDEDGYPLIADNEAFINALEYYIKSKWCEKQFIQGKIPLQTLEYINREYDWAVGQASTSLKTPSLDQLESIANQWTALMPRRDAHSNSYSNLGDKEYYKTH